MIPPLSKTIKHPYRNDLRNCNGSLQASLTWNYRDTFTLDEIKVGSSAGEMGCNTDAVAKDHANSISGVNDRNGAPVNYPEVLNMQDIVIVKNGQA